MHPVFEKVGTLDSCVEIKNVHWAVIADMVIGTFCQLAHNRQILSRTPRAAANEIYELHATPHIPLNV